MHRLRRILVGLDLDEQRKQLTVGSRSATIQALVLAQRTGARIDFLHSIDSSSEEVRPNACAPDAGVEGELEALRGEFGPDVETSGLLLSEERPWVAITRKVLAGEGDLVVVAKRNQSRLDDRLLGSVSMKLVRNCPGPVWVVKPEHGLRHRCVLAATDLSAVGDLATEYGAFIAKADECTLCVVHAWQVPLDLQMSSARIGAEETARLKGEIAESALRHIRELDCVKDLGDRALVSVTCNSPSRVILDVADERDPDLVVMGTVSRGGVAGILVGNTAEKLLYRIDCSILTVKPDDFVCPLDRADSAGE